MNQDMNTIYGQDICNYGAGTLRNCGEGFGGRKAVAALRKDFSRFLRFAAVLLLMVVGVSGAWGAKMDYWFFIVNKSGKIVTYAKANIEQTNNANGNQIPAAIKSVNATNWRLYNGDQLASNLENITLPDNLPQVTKPNASYVVDCSSWGTVTLVDNPTTMSKLSNCESSTRYPNCIFVFYDYNENSVPDLRNGTFYTMQFRGGYTKNGTWDPTNCFLYYNTSNNRMASTANFSGSHPVTNPVTSEEAVNDPKYLWNFKAAEVGGVVDPYDVKIYNAYVGIGDNHYFVANPLDAGSNGAGSGPENDNNKLQPKSILNSDKIASYYIASSSYSGQYNITGKPAYNEGSGKDDIRKTVYYNLWAEYQHDGNTTANISKGGITSQSNFQRSGGRKNFASIILTRVKYTYNIVDAGGNTLVQATTEDNTLEVPDVIKSPLATYTYYGTQQDAIDGTNPLTGSNAGSTTTIYVRYTTNDVLNLKGEIKYNISVGGTNYLYAEDGTTLNSEATSDNNANDNHKWKLNGNDAYQITIKNVGNSNEITYDVSSGEAVPTLSATGSKFFLHQSASGKYEVVAITSNDYSTPNYYTLGIDAGTLKLYSNSSHLLGADEVQSIFTPRSTAAITTPPTANSWTYDGSTQDLVTSGTASNGTMKYRLGDTGDYTESIPTAKDADTYNVYYMAAGDDGYEDFIVADPIEVTVNKQSITVSNITANNKTYDGTTDAELVYTGATLTGKVEGDDLTITATGTFDNKNVGTGKTVTISGLALGGTAASNYELAVSDQQTSTTATITAKEITIGGITASNKEYDGNTTAILVFTGVTFTGKLDGETLTVTATGAFADENVGTGKSVTISGLTLGGLDASNYVLAATGQQATATANITAKEITVSGITAEDKEYDGNNTATLVYTGVTFTDMVEGDDLTITATGLFDNKNVGTDKDVTISGLTLGGSDASNYSLATTGQQTTATADITAKDITASATITVSNKEYDGNTTATLDISEIDLTGKVDGDDIAFTATGTFADKNVGTEKTVTLSLALSGIDAGNYNLTSPSIPASTTADITVKEVTASGTISATNKEYDGTATAVLDYTSVTLTGKVDGDNLTVSATGTFEDANVGTGKTVNISEWVLAGTDKDNYIMASTGQPTTTTADITVANITVSGITADNKEYDGNTIATLDYTNVVLTGKVEGEALTVTATGTFDNKNVGTGKTVTISGWTLDGTDKDNYQLAVSGQQETTAADIIAANITVSGIAASNKEYDGNTTATLDYTNVVLTGKVEGETLTVTATGAFADKNVGTDKTVNISDLALDGTDKDNYQLATTGQQESTTANITPAAATVKADDKTKGYGDADQLTATVTGLKNGDDESVITYTLSRVEGEDVNTVGYTITPSGAAEQGNYTVTYETGTLTITAKDIGDGTTPAEGIDIDITYDGTNYTVTVKQGENTLADSNYTYSGADDPDHPENYVVTVEGQGNYTNSAKATYTKVTFYDTTPDETSTSETWAAVYCASQNLKVNESFEAHYVTNLENNVLTLTKVEAGESKKNYIPANQPMILISDATPAPMGFTLKPYTDTEVVTIPEGSNLLKVVTAEGGLAVALTQVYIFSLGEFVLTKEGTMSKGKFYLDNPNYSTPAPSRGSLRIVSDDTTGINTSLYLDTDSHHSDIWYTIGGQKLSKRPTRKGLYLQNGRKVVIK